MNKFINTVILFTVSVKNAFIAVIGLVLLLSSNGYSLSQLSESHYVTLVTLLAIAVLTLSYGEYKIIKRVASK